MSNRRGVRSLRELLRRLKSTVGEFAEREAALTREYDGGLATGKSELERSLGKLDADLAERCRQADAALASGKAHLQERYEARKPRILRAYQASKRNIAKSIESREGRSKHQLQKDIMHAEGMYPVDRERADSEFKAFNTHLTREGLRFAQLHKASQRSFRGYKRLFRKSAAHEDAAPEQGVDAESLLTALRAKLDQTAAEEAKFSALRLPHVFSDVPLGVLLFLLTSLHAALVGGLYHYGKAALYPAVAVSWVTCVAVSLALYVKGRSRAKPAARTVAGGLRVAEHLYQAAAAAATARHQVELARIDRDYDGVMKTLQARWNAAPGEARASRAQIEQDIDAQEARLSARNEETYRLKTAELEHAREASVGDLTQEAERQKEHLTDAHAAAYAELSDEHEAQWKTLAREWDEQIQPLDDEVSAAVAEARNLFPAWTDHAWGDWSLPDEFSHAAKFAEVKVDLEALAGAVPQDARLPLPMSARFALPMSLVFPDQGSVVFETQNSGRGDVFQTMNNIVLRLLSATPPGKLSFTIIDPVELGQNFAGIMHLADYEETLVNSRIWTQPRQIEQKLADLNEHMEKVIQMYLRNEYETITAYNERAGVVAEKYHFLVVADFPVNFSDIATKRLLSIIASGARCGVYTLIHWDRKRALPQDLGTDDLKSHSVCLTCTDRDVLLDGQYIKGAELALDRPPGAEVTTAFLHKVGQASIDSNRVQVPFEQVAPGPSELWAGDVTEELRVPLGRTGATKLQHLALGRGTRQHALIAGKTGSGKSTLFHVLVTNLALRCSPDQVEFYLVDFKKGVEFKCYATRRLPHARVVAIESDREFGLSVLQRVDQELKRRGDMFRELGVQDLAGYRKANGAETVPRTLLVIDEFQELFVEDDRISQNAALLLDRIVRQGRAFGIHVLLGSQTLGGAYTLARTTLGQMVVRVALQCSEADAYLIMDDNNPAPRLLSRPGEAIYNDAAGAMEANSPFQVVWLPDDERDRYLERVHEHAQQVASPYPPPVVFEGNAPADIRDNEVLSELLLRESVLSGPSSRAWLGAPNSIKGPTEAVFNRQSGHNLLVVGQSDEAGLAMLSVLLVSLAAQHTRASARFVLFDGTAPGSAQREYLDQLTRSLPHEVVQPRGGDVADVMNEIAGDMTRRGAEAGAEGEGPSTFVLVHGLQKFRRLRYEEDFSYSLDDTQASSSPGAQLNQVICEGARLGYHVVLTCDTYNNINRALSRKALSEFEMRVLFQMSAADSASLIDSPQASKLGLYRALFYNEHEGYTEVFRPYALPGSDWVEDALGRLAQSR